RPPRSTLFPYTTLFRSADAISKTSSPQTKTGSHRIAHTLQDQQLMISYYKANLQQRGFRMRVLTAIVLAGMSLSPMLGAGQAETAGEKLTAREMFLAARDAAKKAKPNKPKPPVATAPAPSSPNSTPQVAAAPAPSSPNSTPQVAAAPAPSSPNPAPEARTDVIRALYSSVPLGLR